MPDNQIVPYEYSAKTIAFSLPEAKESQYQKTLTAIRNAWKNSASLDRFGHLWVTSDSLHVMLRTIKGNASYMAASISEEHKITCNGISYIRGCELMLLISKAIEECGTGTRSDYLRYSEQIYMAIRDSDKAKCLRMEANNLLRESRKRLKKTRMRLYNITWDELTGEPLICRDSDFSHIRSFSRYPQLGDNINNGLIVNKSTHEIITKEQIDDEDQLFELCTKKRWRTNWYDRYKEMFC